ncbi:MAG: hypothetical protein KC468_37420 [Myxococcales bacterium]|nr:hypothetical protein [Myxococcales bacterium]
MLATLSIVLAAFAPASGSGADLESKVVEIFEEHCTVCHDAGSDEVDLDAGPSTLIGQKSKTTGKPLVAPGDPSGSYLLAKMLGEKGIQGELMPLGDDRLSDEKIAVVREWIASLSAPAAGGGAATGGAATGGGGADTDTGAGAGTGGADTAALEAELAAKQQAAADAEKPVQALMEELCTSCHDAGADEVALEGSLLHLTSESSKAAGKPFVVPGDVEGSYLWAKMTGAPGIQGEVMPLGDDALPADKLEPVKRWILALGEVEQAKAALAAAGGTAPPDGGGGGGPTGDDSGPTDEAECPKRDRKGNCKVERKRTSEPPFRDIYFVNLPTTAGLGKNAIQFRITHHFGRIGTPRGGFGLDAGAVMSLGVAYGIIDGLDISFRRSNSRKAYELGVKYIPLQQEYGAPVSFGGYASIEYYRDFDTNTSNPVSGNFQLMLSRLWFERWSTQLVLGYHLRTNHAANVTYDFGDGNGAVAVTDTRDTMNVGLASQIRLGKKRYHSIDLEYLFPIPAQVFYWNGALENKANVGAWALGWTAITPSKKHVFKVFLTNTREIHTNLVAPGGQTRNPFPSGQKYPFDFFLGFTISRRWSL